MDTNIKNAIDTVSSVVDVMSNNIKIYANEALSKVKNMKNNPLESEVSPVLGYDTGDNGWYDTIGGGPCNKYCRYTGLNPHVQWTCSDEKDLSKLVSTPKENTGRFCYGYDKKTMNPQKNGVVINGSYISSQKSENSVEDSGNYNFVIYNNKEADGIENFYTTPNSNIIENFDGSATTSCYGASDETCNTCNDVVSAFENKGWGYDTNNFAQCNIPSMIENSCYGAKSENDCHTCNNVVNAYKEKGWTYNTQDFAQCSTEQEAPVNKNLSSINSKWTGPQKMDFPGNDLQSFQINQVSDCGNACYKNNQCVGFVTTDAGNYCWLKSALVTPNNKPDRNTYIINKNQKSTNPLWSGPEKMDYPGNDIKSFSINQVSDCGNACKDDKNCVAFVTDDVVNTCWLKNKLGNSVNVSNRNTYKMNNNNTNVVKNVSLNECENICENDDKCKGFNYDTVKKTCVISENTIKPTNFNTNSISGNKKVHMALNGTFNLYQNNSCINSSLFGKFPSVTSTLGIITDEKGIPKIPKYPVCPNKIDNNFIFGKNYEIMTTSQNNKCDDLKSEVKKSCEMSNNSTDSNALCLQANTDGTVSSVDCTYDDNQKWTFDKNINSIRTWDGQCLNVDTENQNVKVSVKPCKDDINQKFYLKSVPENLQPKDYTVLENFAIDTNINNYLFKNKNSNNYLYKLPYSTPYLQNVNKLVEKFEIDEGNSYFMYLVVLILLLLFFIKKY